VVIDLDERYLKDKVIKAFKSLYRRALKDGELSILHSSEVITIYKGGQVIGNIDYYKNTKKVVKERFMYIPYMFDYVTTERVKCQVTNYKDGRTFRCTYTDKTEVGLHLEYIQKMYKDSGQYLKEVHDKEKQLRIESLEALIDE